MTAALALSLLATALGRTPARAAAKDFTIFDGRTTSPVLIDASYSGEHADRDHQQVRRAVLDLRQDVGMVTGAINAAEVQGAFVDDEAAREARLASADPRRVPALVTDASGQKIAIIVGVIGKSALIDKIIQSGKFDEAAPIAGKWEAYAIKQVANPVPGVDRALVVAGSDARGAVYGVYSISERIGVSPWYWYSDVSVKHRGKIEVTGAALVDDGPDVKYRGIFINDEEQATGWAKAKFPTDKGSPDVSYYRHVYEMMLRLKLNTLWPAMHDVSTAFNGATDTGMYDAGTPINAKEAAAYGVIMSASHAEPMLRNNVGEWRPFYERNKEALDIKGANYTAAFDYSINKPALLQYWRERQMANADFENLVVLGLRGVHDSGPAFTPGNPYGFDNVLEMVGDAITEQRKLIAEVHGSSDAVPQVFVPYKEMGDLYNAGLKAYIPDDVTLMWAEDNFGYLRQVPTRSEAARSGGNGIYYHGSYWGVPKSYLWLNSTPMALMVEELRRAWNTDARRSWILNVGDIKPGEMKTELFAKLAWDVEGYGDTSTQSTFLAEQVARDFGLIGPNATAVVDALSRFEELESTKRAEFWGVSFPLSATSDGDEVQRHVNEANELVDIVEGAMAKLPPPYRSSFYQQVVHRLRGYRDMAEQIGYHRKNQLYAQQGRFGSSSIYELLSKNARDRIKTDEERWDSLSDRKWSKAIHYDHPGGGVVMLDDSQYSGVASPSDGVGANAEGQTVAGSGTLRFNSAAPKDERFFDVFDRNDVAEEWVAEADAPWVDLSKKSGTTGTEQRVTVTVDWPRLRDNATAKVHVYNATDGKKSGDPVATFTVDAKKAGVDLRPRPGECPPASPQACDRGHLEANGYVAVEAENFAASTPGTDGSQWRRLAHVAQRGDVMKAFPETATRVDTNFATSARLTYRAFFTSSGEFTGTFYRVPTLNEGTEDDGDARSARTAIGIDDEVPISAHLRGCAQTGCGSAWGNNVMRQIEPLTFTVNVAKPGWHDLVVYRSDASIIFDRIVIETDSGAVGDGLVGPVESPNNIAKPGAVQKATVAPVPDAVASYRPLPAVALSVGETRSLDDLDDVVALKSDNETAVSVTLDDGEAAVTGNRVGTAQVTVTTEDGTLSSFTATVSKQDDPPLGAYQEKDGRVVMDASDVLEASEYANTIDSNNGTHRWSLNRNGMQASPPATSSSKASWIATSATQAQALLDATPTQKVNGSAAAGTPPRLQFTVDIETGGTYYLFVNSSNPNPDADSYHVAVDGQWRYHSSKGGQETNFETWYGSTSVPAAALSLAPGRHTVSVWAREAGTLVSQIALTTNPSATFTGFLTPSDREDLNP